LVNRYDGGLLRNVDEPRAHLRRSKSAENEWMCSRALLQLIPTAHAVSLSHKLGHAVVAAAPSDWRIGIDLERSKPRDVARLSAWMATPCEAAALAGLAPALALRHFYRLWTFKEAMIKARGQDFPSDLKANELLEDPATGRWRIRTSDSGQWCLRVFEAAPDWVISVVWQAPGGESADLSWHLESDAPDEPFRMVLACETAA
jgi:4'-phosphopantetheinyl transferase